MIIFEIYEQFLLLLVVDGIGYFSYDMWLSFSNFYFLIIGHIYF
jgi:hypothetical protein